MKKQFTAFITASFVIMGINGCVPEEDNLDSIDEETYTLDYFDDADKKFRAYCSQDGEDIIEFLVAFQDYDTYGAGNSIAYIAWKYLADGTQGNTTDSTYSDGGFSIGMTTGGVYNAAKFGFTNNYSDISIELSHFSDYGIITRYCSYNYY